MTFGFYTRTGVWSKTIRYATRLKGQDIATVPSHCSLILSDCVLEAVEGLGVIKRDIAEYDKDPTQCHRVTVILLNELAAEEFAKKHIGDKYDWAAIFLDALGIGFPSLSQRDKCQDRWDCSRYLAWTGINGGLQIADTLRPITPNQILLTLAAIEKAQMKQ